MAGARADRAARSAQVADPAAELAARLDLAADADKSARVYRDWAAAIDPDEPEDLREYEVYATAAELADRFRRLAAEAARIRTAADLGAVRKVAAGVIDRASAIQDDVSAARDEVAAGSAESWPEPAELDAADDYDWPDPLPASDPLGAVRGQWAAKIEAAAEGIPEPVSLPPAYQATAYSRRRDLDAALRAIDAAADAAELAAAIRLAEDAIDSAGRAAGAFRAVMVRRAPLALPGPPAPRTPSMTDALAQMRAARAALARRHGYCQSGRHGFARALGNGLPPAQYIYQGGNQDPYRGNYRVQGAPAIKVCAARKCRAAAESWLRAQGYPDNRQVYDALKG